MSTAAMEHVDGDAGAEVPAAGSARHAAASVEGGGTRAALSANDLAELIGAFNDVTAKLERSHDQLRREVERLTRELSEANAQIERSRRLAALGEMAAGIAHEVRNPLGSIRLYARMLEQDLADRPSERGIAVKIGGAATSLAAVVGDVLTFAREFRIVREPVNAGELFDQAVEACCHDGVEGSRGVRIERAGSPSSVEFEGDAGLLKQALVNVVRNGIEAMAAAGPGVGHVLTLEAERRGGRTVLRVRDTGTGIGPEVAGRIFNPFFTTRKTGTGLGLSIVHRIAEAHGGVVTIRNNGESAASGEVGEGLRPSARGAEQAPGACVEIVIPDEGRQESGAAPERAKAVGVGVRCGVAASDRAA